MYIGLRLDAAVNGNPIYSQGEWTASKGKELMRGMKLMRTHRASTDIPDDWGLTALLTT
jgi:hypothetical protein